MKKPKNKGHKLVARKLRLAAKQNEARRWTLGSKVTAAFGPLWQAAAVPWLPPPVMPALSQVEQAKMVAQPANDNVSPQAVIAQRRVAMPYVSDVFGLLVQAGHYRRACGSMVDRAAEEAAWAQHKRARV